MLGLLREEYSGLPPDAPCFSATRLSPRDPWLCVLRLLGVCSYRSTPIRFWRVIPYVPSVWQGAGKKLGRNPSRKRERAPNVDRQPLFQYNEGVVAHLT